MQLDLIPKPAIERASARRDAGMEPVRDSAEREVPNWTALALDAVRRFAAHQGGYFTMEQCRAVVQAELPHQPRLRAWGGVTQSAIRAGFIEPVRGQYAPAASSNGSPKPMYRKGPRAS